MNAELFGKIVELVALVIATLISCYVFPYLKTKINSSVLAQLEEYAKFGVRSAEMYFDSDMGKQKKEFVMNYLTEIINTKLHCDITEEELENIVESTVYSVKYEVSKYAYNTTKE